MKETSDFEIAPGFKRSQWASLGLTAESQTNWEEAIQVFDRRLTERFFDPVDALIPGSKFGFAILAIDLLVIEALAGFQAGQIDHRNKSQDLFRRFLTSWRAFTDRVPPGMDPRDAADLIYKGYRCELLHSAATDGDLRIGVTGPMVQFDGPAIKINRTKFHASLKAAHQSFLSELRDPTNIALRKNFLRKMNAVCGL